MQKKNARTTLAHQKKAGTLKLRPLDSRALKGRMPAPITAPVARDLRRFCRFLGGDVSGAPSSIRLDAVLGSPGFVLRVPAYLVETVKLGFRAVYNADIAGRGHR